MSIRISNDGLAGAAAAETSRAQETSRAASTDKTGQGSSASGEDQVQISSLSENIAAQASQRAQHVQSLAAAYQSGRYQVNSQDVSRALVNDALKAGSTESDK